MTLRVPHMGCTAALLASMLSTAALGDPSIGVYYYPWWGPTKHDITDTHRDKLDPQGGLPLVMSGDHHDSRDLWTIASHIDQSQAGNISLWVSSWWGPQSYENDVLRNNILTHPHAGRIKHAVFYETTGRLKDKNNPNWTNFSNDFDYLAANVLTDPNYLQIDGKPAVFVYVSRAYLTSNEAATQIANVRQQVKDDHGIDLYLVGDHVFNRVAANADSFDAISAYDVYGQTHKPAGGTFRASADTLRDTYADARTQADNLGIDLIPTISPGYNDRQTRDGNVAAPRYYEDADGGVGTFGDPFVDQLNLAAKPFTDADTGDLIMVNSFNEWHEDTQIEVLRGSDTTNQDTTNDNQYTQDKYYEGYGTRYLDILRTNTGGPDHYQIFNGLVGDGNQDGALDNDDILALGRHLDEDSSDLSLRNIALHGDWDLDGTTELVDDLQLLVGYLNDAGNNITYEAALQLIAMLPVGDLNEDDQIDIDDWAIFITHAQSDMTGLTEAEAYRLGDLDGDLDNDLQDFILFRDAYELANPEPGAFEAMLAAYAVPEPSAALILVSTAPMLLHRRPRH